MRTPSNFYVPGNIRALEEWQKRLSGFLRRQAADEAHALGLTVADEETLESIRRRITAKRAELKRERETLLAEAEALDLLFPDGLTNAQIAGRIESRRAELESSGSELLDKLELLCAQAECFFRRRRAASRDRDADAPDAGSGRASPGDPEQFFRS